MAMIMNFLEVQQDGTFNYTPQWDYSPLGNIDGCPPEFVGTFILFPIGENVSEIFNVISFDNSTGQIIGTVDLAQIPSSGTAFGYGLNRCDTSDSYPSWNVNYTIQQLFVHYSKNPIEPYIATAGSATTEVEIFAETYRSSEVYVSLGVFTYRADNAGLVSIDISKILDAHLGNNVKQGTINSVAQSSVYGAMYYNDCLFYVSYRYQSAGTWTEWQSTDPRIVVYGGRAYEDVSTENLNLSPGWLTSESEILSAINKQTILTALIGLAGNYYFRISDYDDDGILIDTTLYNIGTNFDYTIYFLKVNPIGRTAIAELLDTNQDLIDSIDIRTRASAEETTEFLYFSGSGGWRNLSCEGTKISVIESNQELYENEKPSAYYLQSDIANLRVWKTKGIKRYKVATGFLPQGFIQEQIQDFLLSPYRYVWDVDKWIPIICTTKSFEFLNNKETNLRSFTFEYRHSFEDNIYTNR
jgi:hypothetical protein